MTSGDGPVQDPFERAWRELEAAWEDDAAHRRFIAFCNFQGALPEAGRRYREVQERDPARRDEAQRRLGAVLQAALASLDPAVIQPPQRRTRLFWGVCGVILALSGYGIFTVLQRFAP